ncbi:MAG: GCN5-related N-acetyltransferase [Eubacterium sp.]|jgi:GNAT superfamily N-acetyltransferase|nr:GCN5-related N-acetyltransferase [Eubacterium sp.]
MIYRKATIEDINELVRLRIDFVREVQKVESTEGDEQLIETLTEYFGETMKEDAFISWLAIEDGRIVGTSGVCFYKLPPSFKNISGKTAYIMNMYTLPDFRGKGIANILFQKIVEEAKNHGCEKITLNATDMGRPIYRKYGFVDSQNDMILN